MEKPSRTRNTSFDILRIIAVLAVVMLHTSSIFISKKAPDTSEFLTGNLFNGISRIGVPLFLMISGALFLDESKTVTLRSILKKNVKNLLIIALIWGIFYSVIYNVVFPLQNGKSVDIEETVLGIFNGHYHMWYLYMIVGLYLATPFLRKFVTRENKALVLFFILFSFTVQFLLPTVHKICVRQWGIDYIGNFVGQFKLDFFGKYITYYLLGWYITHIGIQKKYLRVLWYLAGIFSLVFMLLYVHFTGDYKSVYNDIGAPVFLYASAVFLAVSRKAASFGERASRRIAALSKLTFGVYLIHVLLLRDFRKLFPYVESPALYILISFITVLFASFLFSYVLSKLPLVKKIIKA